LNAERFKRAFGKFSYGVTNKFCGFFFSNPQFAFFEGLPEISSQFMFAPPLRDDGAARGRI
jgi:hypothetical protein